MTMHGKKVCGWHSANLISWSQGLIGMPLLTVSAIIIGSTMVELIMTHCRSRQSVEMVYITLYQVMLVTWLDITWCKLTLISWNLSVFILLQAYSSPVFNFTVYFCVLLWLWNRPWSTSVWVNSSTSKFLYDDDDDDNDEHSRLMSAPSGVFMPLPTQWHSPFFLLYIDSNMKYVCFHRTWSWLNIRLCLAGW